MVKKQTEEKVEVYDGGEDDSEPQVEVQEKEVKEGKGKRKYEA